MKKWLDAVAAFCGLGAAVYCLVAAARGWPANEVSWTGAAIAYVWAARELLRTSTEAFKREEPEP